jgi:Zn-dependent peptidase ImmA (M78 family)
MPGAIPFRISPAVLEWARISMGYSIDEAAKKMDVSLDKYEEWETGKKTPTYKQLEALSERVFKRSLAILFLPNPPAEDSIQKDFRNLSNAEINSLSPEVRLCLRKAKRFQLILKEVTQFEKIEKYKEFRVSFKDNPELTALRFRQFINLPLQEQKAWKYDNAFNLFKEKLEAIGIYIFQLKMPLEQARAFCLSDDIPVIVLSTEDSKNGKVFSLFHEVCHVFFNINGIFRDNLSGNLNREYVAIESFCNQFAAAFLVPDNDFDNELAYGQDITRLARKYNVSNEVIARKLLYKKRISSDDFWKMKMHWDTQAKAAKEREKEKMKENDVRGISQANKILFEKGKPFTSSVISAYQSGRLSSSDLSSYLETKLDHLPKLLERLNS